MSQLPHSSGLICYLFSLPREVMCSVPSSYWSHRRPCRVPNTHSHGPADSWFLLMESLVLPCPNMHLLPHGRRIMTNCWNFYEKSAFNWQNRGQLACLCTAPCSCFPALQHCARLSLRWTRMGQGRGRIRWRSVSYLIHYPGSHSSKDRFLT